MRLTIKRVTAKQLRAKMILAGFLMLAIGIVYSYSSERSDTATTAVSDAAGRELQNRLQGTWESTGSKTGTRQVKLITKNHFTWVFYNSVTHSPITVAGGTCTFSGDTYTEHVEFGSAGVQHTLAGHDQVFTITFEGNLMNQSGTLSNGMPINETWRRLD